MSGAALVLACLTVASVASDGGELGLEPALGQGAWVQPSWIAHHQQKGTPLGWPF